MRRSLVSVIAAAALLASVGGSAAPTLDQEVNTFIGTQDEGNTFPGASAPFGLIQVSPIGSHYAGWQYTDPKIRGFGHSFISGAGCWAQGGQLSMLPVTGSIGPGAAFDTAKASSFDQTKYAAAYSHNGEVGRAGYYKVRLTDYGGIDVEATALTRASAERYTFEQGTSEGDILVNVGQADEKHDVVGSDLQVIGDHTIVGKIVTDSFCGGQQYATWFHTEFSRPFKSFGVWTGDGGTPGSRAISTEGDGHTHGAWFTFDLGSDRTVTAITSISHVDPEGALANLRADGIADGKLITFDAMRTTAETAWRNELASIQVAGGSTDDRSVFYTALYHALLQPLTGSDADGRYRGYDEAIHRTDGWTYYEYFSLWDTYRAQNQLIAMLRPGRAKDIARSMLVIHDQNGWLPRWGYANFDTNVMSGDPVTPWLVDLWRFGALDGREKEAYAALRENAFGTPPPLVRSQGRGGNPSYLAHGFVQYDRAFPAKSMDADPQHGASATFEYALADCSLSQMATALGETADASTLRQRGGNWHKLWDPGTVDAATGFKGFPRPRLEDGFWYVDPNGSFSPRSQAGFHEGTAWQYQWLTQQDVPGLVEALGGKDQADKRLDAFFAYDQLVADPAHAARKQWVVGPYDYYNQYRYNPNNEPDLHAPWTYALIGEPWKTAMVLRAAQALFTNAPNGVTGNDDLGTMSAWYLFSAMGIYPSMPGSGDILLNAPRFSRITVALGSGRTLVINAPDASANGVQYVQGIRFNGRRLDRAWLSWDELRNGGRIDVMLGARPSRWGTADAGLPPAVCPSR